MATDEAIWLGVAQRLVPPTLRLYSWSPPCLSLGRHQPAGDAHHQALRALGYDLVRRPTGGRAILHTDELTYSVAVPLKDPRVRGDVLSSCRRLSEGLLAAMQFLGVGQVVAAQRAPRPAPPDAVCFEAPGTFEIAAGGRKLIGSAQMRGRGALLQHGTLPLCGDIARICAVLAVPADPERVRSRAATLEQLLGHPVSWEQAADAVAVGFAQSLNLRLERGGLTPQERETARQLQKRKYGSEAWTARV